MSKKVTREQAGILPAPVTSVTKLLLLVLVALASTTTLALAQADVCVLTKDDNPYKIASISAFSDSFALACAIALAYAALDHFRYRIEVERYTRMRTGPAFYQILRLPGKFAAKSEHYAVLHRLGNLEELHFPKPLYTARHFENNPTFKVFNWRYCSDLDKVVAIGLGSVAAAGIWFGAIDQIFFPDPQYPSVDRCLFVNALGTFFLICAAASLALIFGYAILWRWNLKERGWGWVGGQWRASVLRGLKVAWSGVFLLSLIAVSLHSNRVQLFLADFYPRTEKLNFLVFSIVLIFCVLGPIMLVIRGRALREKIKDEVDFSFAQFSKEVAEEGVGSAEFRSS